MISCCGVPLASWDHDLGIPDLKIVFRLGEARSAVFWRVAPSDCGCPEPLRQPAQASPASIERPADTAQSALHQARQRTGHYESRCLIRMTRAITSLSTLRCAGGRRRPTGRCDPEHLLVCRGGGLEGLGRDQPAGAAEHRLGHLRRNPPLPSSSTSSALGLV
jgi:hypothetical protein